MQIVDEHSLRVHFTHRSLANFCTASLNPFLHTWIQDQPITALYWEFPPLRPRPWFDAEHRGSRVPCSSDRGHDKSPEKENKIGLGILEQHCPERLLGLELIAAFTARFVTRSTTLCFDKLSCGSSTCVSTFRTAILLTQ